MPHDARGYLRTSEGGAYYSPNWLGGYISYDVDMSAAGCSCNVALYLVQMPGSNGGYCDANKVGGFWCPEFDIMEANKYAWHSTPHTCDSTSPPYNNCDRGGSCFQVAHQKGANDFGPGKTIDTNQKFNAKMEWATSGDFKLTLTQNGKTWSMGSDGQCGGYMSKMSTALGAGMGIAISSWGSDWNTMKWLDSDTGCSGDCNNNPTLHISNIDLKVSPGHTPPSGGSFDYGDPCAHPNDGKCGNSCSDCRWSWPSNDPAKWSSKDAACRCKPG